MLVYKLTLFKSPQSILFILNFLQFATVIHHIDNRHSKPIVRPNMILKQNIPYAALICSALDVCEVMLARSTTLYPFAVMSIGNDVHSVFSDVSDEGISGGLIEDLTARLCERRLHAENAISVLVYAAALQTDESTASDAIVFNITDTNGKNTITLYPYCQEADTIKLGAPFTCNFAD